MSDYIAEDAASTVNEANDKSPGSAALAVIAPAEVFHTGSFSGGSPRYENTVNLIDIRYGGRWIAGKRCQSINGGPWEPMKDDREFCINLDHVLMLTILHKPE